MCWGDSGGGGQVDILSSKIANGQLAQNDLCSSLVDGLHLVVDDLPLCIDDGLVFRNLLDTDFGIVLFGLELQLDVQADNGGVLEIFRLLLKTGV